MRILYIDIDSLRPDHLSCYGYHRHTSPNIDALAQAGVRYNNIFASDTPCLPSRTGFFGGMFGLITGVINHGGVFADLPSQGADRAFRSTFAENTLATVLRRAGYHTSSISPFPNRHTAYQVWYGFSETHDTGKGGMENADEIYPVLKDWLERNGAEDNWFLHVNFWDPHTPYDHPAAYGNPFENEPLEPWITQELLDKQNGSYGPHSASEVSGWYPELPANWPWGAGELKTVSDAKVHMDGYDTGIHYADFYVGKVMALLDQLGIAEETAVIISADHGENQGELNVWGDHQTADIGTNRIPLIIKWPGKTENLAGQAVDDFHYHLDVAATIVDLAGGEIPGMWNGESFGKALGGGNGRPYLILSHGAWSCQRSVRWDNWLLIRTYHTGIKAFPKYMLFDIENDPHEQHNLAAKHPDLVGAGLQRMDEWLGDLLPTAWRGDPIWGVIQEGGPLHANVHDSKWAEYVARLRNTGRAHHAEHIEKIESMPID
ncbi:MAG: sulfatase [Chloroflexota bacterium]